MNEGPMTGRGLGQCTGAYGQGQDTGAAPGMGWGGGQGRGMGLGRRGCRYPRGGMGRGARFQFQAPQPTKASLTARAQQLEAELKAVQDELKQMADE